MPSTATYSPTGDPNIDGVLSGIKWGVDSLTFSFPDNSSYYGSSYGNGENLNGFEALTGTQQAAVREILKMYSAVTNVSFTEVSETSSVHGDLRYAESDGPSTAWAYYPSTNPAGGDAWFNNSKNWYDNPAKGNYAWLTMIHETGHAMGLKHPHEARGSFAAMPTDKDSLEYSVMSYRSYVGASTSSGYTNASTSYPQTLMMYDIAALQKMYGADYTTNAGDTVYSWSATTGQMFVNDVGEWAPAGNKIFMTLWDGGGTDTYDFSNYTTNLKVDLDPGGWSTTSSTQLASLGNGHVAVGNIANALLYNNNTASLIENAVGGSGNDTILGNAADNLLTGGRGNDVLDGRGGTDTAVYSGASSDYSWFANDDGSWTIGDLRSGSPDGTDTLTNIEFLRFSDLLLALGESTTTLTDPPTPPGEPNGVPSVLNDSYAAFKNTKLVVAADAGVLANDSDPNGDPLSAILVSGSSKGKVALAADGSFVFTPNKKFTGTTTFKYKADDGTDSSSIATVSITVAKPARASKTKKTNKNKKGAGEDHHKMDDDQIPAASGHDAVAGFSNPHTEAVARTSLVVSAAVTDGLIDHLLQTVSGLDAPTFASVETRPDHGDIDLTGLPDFLKTYASDFILA